MQFEITAQKRVLQGRGASRRLRRTSKVPGIVYGGTQAPQSIELDHNKLLINLKKEAFRSSILTLDIEGQKEQVLLRDTQFHAYKPLVLHIDFQRVDATHELHIKVPLHFVNGEIAPGVKISGGMVNHILTEIDISCLPADLPGFIEVDLSELAIGQNIHVSQLKMPKGVKAMLHGTDDPIVVAIVGMGGAADEEVAAEGEGEAAAA
jgi:large subunit ribosomal protein L25